MDSAEAWRRNEAYAQARWDYTERWGRLDTHGQPIAAYAPRLPLAQGLQEPGDGGAQDDPAKHQGQRQQPPEGDGQAVL